METKEVQIKDIWSCKEIPVIRAKYYEKDVFIIWFYVYKAASAALTPSNVEMLSSGMESSNTMVKSAAAVHDKDKVVDIFPRKIRKIWKINFLFFESRQKLFLQDKYEWKGRKRWR